MFSSLGILTMGMVKENTLKLGICVLKIPVLSIQLSGVFFTCLAPNCVKAARRFN